MRSNADYGWILAVVFVIIMIFAWKPMMGMFSNMSDKASNKEGYERGRVVFYDTTRWTGPEGYKSCAMCHAADFKPEPGRKIEMMAYKEGEPIILKGISGKYGTSILGTGDELYQQCIRCLTQGDRMGMGRVSAKAVYMQDLLEYVKKQ